MKINEHQKRAIEARIVKLVKDEEKASKRLKDSQKEHEFLVKVTRDKDDSMRAKAASYALQK